ncbi:MAG: heat shock protein HspQ, partial [Plesiomonas shigelloides]
KMLGSLGVILDVDAEYSLQKPTPAEMGIDDALRLAPWYHVVMENEEGEPVHTYIAEMQLDRETLPLHPDQPNLDDLADTIVEELEKNRALH